jgi:hypothetical protein
MEIHRLLFTTSPGPTTSLHNQNTREGEARYLARLPYRYSWKLRPNIACDIVSVGRGQHHGCAQAQRSRVSY